MDEADRIWWGTFEVVESECSALLEGAAGAFVVVVGKDSSAERFEARAVGSLRELGVEVVGVEGLDSETLGALESIPAALIPLALSLAATGSVTFDTFQAYDY